MCEKANIKDTPVFLKEELLLSQLLGKCCQKLPNNISSGMRSSRLQNSILLVYRWTQVKANREPFHYVDQESCKFYEQFWSSIILWFSQNLRDSNNEPRVLCYVSVEGAVLTLRLILSQTFEKLRFYRKSIGCYLRRIQKSTVECS